MRSEKVNIIINSTLLYVIAFLLTTILHELFHALFGMYNNSDPILHHNFVEHLSIAHLSVFQKTAIALAGPLISLCQGFAAAWLFIKSRKQGLLQLFLLWFSILGFNNFLGYIMTGPLFSAGDIGKVYLLTETPIFLQIFVAILGAIALLFIANKITAPFLQFSYKQNWIAESKARKNFSFRILILPWIFGSFIITLMYLPIIALISIIYPVMSGFVFIYPWQNSNRVTNIAPSESQAIGKISILAISLLLVLAIIFKFCLAPGIKLFS